MVLKSPGVSFKSLPAPLCKEPVQFFVATREPGLVRRKMCCHNCLLVFAVGGTGTLYGASHSGTRILNTKDSTWLFSLVVQSTNMLRGYPR